MRTENSIKNAIYAIVGQTFMIFLAFAVRSVFIHTLNAEYLGINGLFSDILSMLSLAEMGIGTAITYSLYSPIALNDYTKIKSLMRLYKKSYNMIGIVIFILGVVFLPFMKFVIKGDINIPYIHIIYIIFVLNNSLSYFFVYKQSLITTHQKSYIVTRITYLFTLVSSAIQIAILLLFKNYIAVLILQLLITVIRNMYLSHKADSMFPYLKEKSVIKLPKTDFIEILKNIKALIIYNMGGALVSGTDNIIISSIVGVIWVGYYSNYLLIITAVTTILSMIFSSITASIGNLNVLEEMDKKEQIFRVINLVNFIAVNFCSISLLVLLNPFISLWIGKSYLLNMSCVFFVVLNFYLTGMMNTTWIYRSTMGLFVYGRYRPLISAAINIAFSIVLAKYLGIAGVFMGTAITRITTNIWYDPLVIYKHGFHQSVVKYYLKYLSYTAVTFACGIITYYLSNIVIGVSIYAIIAKALFCLIIPNALVLIIFFKTNEMRYLLKAIQHLILHKKTGIRSDKAEHEPENLCSR